MKLRHLALAALGCFLACVAVLAYEPTAEEKKELDVALERWVTTYNTHEAEELSMEYAEDADVIVPSGEHVKSRKAFEKATADYFSKNPKVTTKISDVSRTFLTPEIVVEDGVWEDSNVTEPGGPSKGLYSTILMKRDGKWIIVHERAWTRGE